MVVDFGLFYFWKTVIYFGYDVVFWQKPRGVFTIEKKKQDGSPEERQMILVASGTGLAPFMSYILHLRKIGSKKKFGLIGPTPKL